MDAIRLMVFIFHCMVFHKVYCGQDTESSHLLTTKEDAAVNEGDDQAIRDDIEVLKEQMNVVIDDIGALKEDNVMESNEIQILQDELLHEKYKRNELELEVEALKRIVCNMSQESQVCKQPVNYASLHHNTYEPTSIVKVESLAERLHAYDSELWLTAGTNLHVYSHQMTLLRTIALAEVRSAESVIRTETGQLLVADYVKGLHLLYGNGSHLEMLHNVGTKDMIIHQHRIYAITTSDPAQIYIYAQNDTGKWVEVDRLTLPYRGQRLAIHGHKIYVSDGVRDHLYEYSKRGKLLAEHGARGVDRRGSEGGLFSEPFICSVDKHGNVLIADRFNYRVQVYQESGAFNVLSLGGRTEQIKDVIVSHSGKSLWVIEFNTQDWKYYLINYLV